VCIYIYKSRQCDAQKSKFQINISAVMQTPFKSYLLLITTGIKFWDQRIKNGSFHLLCGQVENKSAVRITLTIFIE